MDKKIFDHYLNQNVSALSAKTYHKDGIQFRIKHFLSFSADRYQDLNYYHETFAGRMPDELFAIAAVDDSSNLLLMEKSGSAIYFWDHELNDRGIEGNDTWPVKVGENLNSFLGDLKNDDLPSNAESALAKEEGKVRTVTPLGLEVVNKDREMKGLPPLTMKDVYKGI